MNPLDAISQALDATPAPARGLDLDLGLARVEDRLAEAALARGLDVIGPIAAEAVASGGKRLRARLALAATEALGVNADATPWAAAVETLHNATLVHDDVQDGDTHRRGRPTTWVNHGTAQAINAGDLLLFLPTSRHIAAVAADERVKWRLALALAAAAEEVVRGQALDLSLRGQAERDASLDVAQAFLTCCAQKTGALFALPVEGAALLRGDAPAAARALAAPFGLVGVLFQLQDDVLDLFGDKGRDKPGGDVKEGKVSVLVAEHLRLHPEDRAALLTVLKKPRELTTDDDVRDVTARFARGGALDAALRRIEHLARQAHGHPALDEEPALRGLLVALVARVLEPIRHLVATGPSCHGRAA